MRKRAPCVVRSELGPARVVPSSPDGLVGEIEQMGGGVRGLVLWVRRRASLRCCVLVHVVVLQPCSRRRSLCSPR